MAKSQFQSTEDLLIRLPPFISTEDGSYFLVGSDCTLVVVKPDGTLYAGAIDAPAQDANTGHWKSRIAAAHYIQGVWTIKATSTDTGALEQFREIIWGDYVDDITLTKTQATTAASQATTAASQATTAASQATAAASSAASADGKCTTIAAVTSALPTFPSDPADESALEAVIAGVSTKLGTPVSDIHTELVAVKSDTADIKAVTAALPVFPSDPADESALEAVIAAVQGDVTTIKAKTDVPSAIADQTTLSSVASNINTIKTGVAQLQTIAKGHWKVVGYQLILYDETEAVIVRFNLYDDLGQPTNSRIFERRPV